MKAKITMVVELEYELNPEYYKSKSFEGMIEEDLNDPEQPFYVWEQGQIVSLTGTIITDEVIDNG